MKSAVVMSALLALTAAAPSRKHQHHQHNQHKRAVTVTVVEYADNDTTEVVTETPTPAPAPTTSTSSASISTIAKAAPAPVSSSSTSTSATVVPTTSSTSTSTTSTSSTSSTSSASKTSTTSTAPASTGSSSKYGDLSPFVDPTVEFQDGVHDCSSLPTGQGVVGVNWISGLTGGFTTIMNQNGDTSEVCKDGFYCSYACQAGMSKTQWPSEQPANGISMGGLYCQNGKLYRSNTDTNFLCTWGKQTSTFVSNINQDVAICRTDYPGSENMNIPTLLEAGSTAPVSVVDSDNYYNWRGGKTSTQYYVNNAGVSVEDGCIWGTDGSGVGNWAPVVLGAGFTGGNTYLSLIPNPNNRVAPNYNIKIQGTQGSTTVGTCSYEGGVYLGGHGSDGCTLTVSSGSANFIFY